MQLFFGSDLNVAPQFDVSPSVSHLFSANNRKEPSGASAGGIVDAVSPNTTKGISYIPPSVPGGGSKGALNLVSVGEVTAACRRLREPQPAASFLVSGTN